MHIQKCIFHTTKKYYMQQ